MAERKMPARMRNVRSRRSVMKAVLAVTSVLHLPQIAVHDRTVNHGVVVSPQDQVGNFTGRDESAKAVHLTQIVEHGVVVANMLAQHAGIGEAGTDECGMNASAHEVLTGCPHHAQLGMMRATCQDLMGRGIHTALICPGFTDTSMLRQHVGHDDTVLDNLGEMNSFGRLVAPSEIADLILWAHDHPVINGSVMHGNLGQVEH